VIAVIKSLKFTTFEHFGLCNSERTRKSRGKTIWSFSSRWRPCFS